MADSGLRTTRRGGSRPVEEKSERALEKQRKAEGLTETVDDASVCSSVKTRGFQRPTSLRISVDGFATPRKERRQATPADVLTYSVFLYKTVGVRLSVSCLRVGGKANG